LRGSAACGCVRDGRTHNLLIIRKDHAPEQMFCAPRPADSYQIDGHSYSAFGACYASVTSPAWSPAVGWYLSQREGSIPRRWQCPGAPGGPGTSPSCASSVPQNPHKSGSAEWFPTESPRTKRHSPAHDGTDANMPLPPLTGLYAGSAGLTILKLPVVRAGTDLLKSGRSIFQRFLRYCIDAAGSSMLSSSGCSPGRGTGPCWPQASAVGIDGLLAVVRPWNHTLCRR
jgi:hypothetical protein